MKTKINATIVAHSVNEQGDELISVLATFPRIILAEVNTHRMLSKNTSSSRAIPFNKMVETIQNDPFIPIAWQEDHKGMQGTKYLEGAFARQAEQEWLIARDYALSIAGQMNSSTYVTKQLCNRLLEPFMWTTMLITGPKSGWDNFFHLRCPSYGLISPVETSTFKSKIDYIKHVESILGKEEANNVARMSDLDWLKVNSGQAEIHMMALAECIWDAYNESTPKKLEAGEWHIPFRSKMDLGLLHDYYNTLSIPPEGSITKFEEETLVKVSVAMAARTSYTVVGEEKAVNYEAMIGLHDRLLAQTPLHSSPLEHCARTMNHEEYYTFIKGQTLDDKVYINKKSKGWCNNFKGFIPYRYLIDNEKTI
jgi:hypothetical protein